jgi:glutamate dehydrogenase/leucine dehydrogenase
MLKTKGESMEGKTVAISGSGNVAQFAAQKCLHLGAKVISLSDSNGTIYIPDGLTKGNWDYVMDLKNIKRGRIKECVGGVCLEGEEEFVCEYHEGDRPWKFHCDVALPCATQNEIEAADAKNLINNGVLAVAEGANMPSTPEAVDLFHENGVLFGPGKAANAGGVATSGLEMCQNHIGMSWSFEEVDKQLHTIMVNIFKNSSKAAEKYGQTGNLVAGANIAGFLKVADSMIDLGVL